jgi:TonB-dependent SusC/RagA subfamily outer membrane receptor
MKTIKRYVILSFWASSMKLLMMMRLLIVMLLILFWCADSSAQYNRDIYWEGFENSIDKKKNLRQAQQSLDSLIRLYSAAAEHGVVARCLSLRLRITDLTTEDTLFFKNSQYLDSILQSPASSPSLKMAMHVAKAQRIRLYKSKFVGNKKRILVASYSATQNFSMLSSTSLDSMVIEQYDTAISIAHDISKKEEKIVPWLWLYYDPLIFLYKPEVADIVYAEYIDALWQMKKVDYPENHRLVFSSGSDAFIDTLQSWGSNEKIDTKLWKIYINWLNFNHDKPSAYYYIESVIKKQIFQHSNQNETKTAYEKYLYQLSESGLNTVRAHGIYQLCLLWNNDAGLYNSNKNLYRGEIDEYSFDTAHQYQYVKALELFNNNRSTFDSFTFINDVLSKMAENITAKKLQLTIEKIHLPGTPMLGEISFKNIRQFKYRIVSLIPGSYSQGKEKMLSVHLLLPDVAKGEINIPDTKDFQSHSSYIKLDGLREGKYLLLFTDGDFNDMKAAINFTGIEVTNIAVLQHANTIFILDRATGNPLDKAAATINYTRDNTSNKEIVTEKVQVKLAGKSSISLVADRAGFIDITTANDSFRYYFNSGTRVNYDDTYNEDNYDDLLEYYEEHIEVHIYTDRAIYRPGQLVHYKGIITIKHPKTGEPVILNWKNLSISPFKKLIYKLALKFSKQKLEFGIYDPEYKLMDSMRLLPNKYGSFSGTFRLPKNASTGEWSIESDNLDNASSNNDGTFLVEEYKRPTYDLSIGKPAKLLLPGDEFEIKIKTRSIAGAALNNVKICYTIERAVFENYSNQYANEQWVDTAYSDNKGELTIKLRDSFFAAKNWNDEEEITARYEIKVKSIDGTGESKEAEERFDVSSRPLKISVITPRYTAANKTQRIVAKSNTVLGGWLTKNVKIEVYRVVNDSINPRYAADKKVDTWLFPREEMVSHFKTQDLFVNIARIEIPVLSNMIETNNEGLEIKANELLPGNYKVKVTCMENGKLIGETKSDFIVYDVAGGWERLADEQPIHTADINFANSRQLISKQFNNAGTQYAITQVSYHVITKKGRRFKHQYQFNTDSQGVNDLKFDFNDKPDGIVQFSYTYVRNNKVFTKTENIFVPDNATASPELRIESYRKVMAPGAKEKFIVSIKSKSRDEAELMTTMYDAALDRIEPHHWSTPSSNNRYSYPYNAWQTVLNESISENLYHNYSTGFPVQPRYKLIWWLPEQIKIYPFYHNNSDETTHQLQGRAAGVQVLSTYGLNEVVVTGYATRRSLTYSTNILVRGSSSLQQLSGLMIIIDGVPFTGSLSSFDANLVTESMILKGADATAIYGSRAAEGILIISTKGKIILPEPMQIETPPVIRKNFNESAFFYPALHPDRNGYYTISFTLPESVTEWKWKMLAHNKKSQFVYAEKTILSQLPLMVQPAVPRFVYQGDKIEIATRISNLDSMLINGKISCVIEDMSSGENVGKLFSVPGPQSFEVKPGDQQFAYFSIVVPDTFQHAVKIKIAAASNTFGDGEEHIIPVLSKQKLFSYHVNVNLGAGKAQTITLPDAEHAITPYGLGLTIQPQPQSAVLYALPYLANYTYNCAEQMFNKLYAFSLGYDLNKNGLKNIAPKVAVTEDKTPEPDEEAGTLLEIMPWLKLDQKQKIQQAQLNKILDTVYAKKSVSDYFNKISELQQADGGVSWFPGGKSNPFISMYLLAGFGKMVKEQSPSFHLISNNTQYEQLIEKLISYCDAAIVSRDAGVNKLFGLYARAYWVQQFPMHDSTRFFGDSVIRKNIQNYASLGLGQQAMLILAAKQLGKTDPSMQKQADDLIRSLEQRSIRDVNGMRWKEIADEDDLSYQTEEWLVKLAEVFETNDQPDNVKEIIKWILKNKTEHQWSSTRSTGDVVGLLNRNTRLDNDQPGSVSLQSDNVKLTTNNELLTGRIYDFSKLNAGSGFAAAAITNTGNTEIDASASYYYFSDRPLEPASDKSLHIFKNMYKWNAQLNRWDLLNDGVVVIVGDKLRTEIVIRTAKTLRYVFIEDGRAATLEPADPHSGYEYEDGFSYYRSIRDQGMHFFAEKIPAGENRITYETVVSAKGICYNGLTSLQCMYNPNLSAYTKGMIITAKQ